MKRTLTLLIALLSALPGSLHAADFILVDQEASRPAPIIVFQDAPPRTRDAAVTLADYIEKISGQRPAVIDGEPKPLPERAIWVGVQPAVKTLFPKIDFDFQHPEETLIVGERKASRHRRARPLGSGAHGGEGAAGDEDRHAAGIWHGERGLYLPPGPARRALAVAGRGGCHPARAHRHRADASVRYHPQIRARGGMLQKLSLGDNKEGADELWARFQRVQLDSMELLGGHGFGDWWEKYGREHPEYFAAAPDGSRTPRASNPQQHQALRVEPRRLAAVA